MLQRDLKHGIDAAYFYGKLSRKNNFSAQLPRKTAEIYARGASEHFFHCRNTHKKIFFPRSDKARANFLGDFLRPAARRKIFSAQLLAGGLTELLARLQSSTLGDTTTHSTGRRPAGCSSSRNIAEEEESLLFVGFGRKHKSDFGKRKSQGKRTTSCAVL
jgi:hypothetical protein